jgi:hypothetical protein
VTTSPIAAAVSKTSDVGPNVPIVGEEVALISTSSSLLQGGSFVDPITTKIQDVSS